jgi:hypothetical protein
MKLIRKPTLTAEHKQKCLLKKVIMYFKKDEEKTRTLMTSIYNGDEKELMSVVDGFIVGNYQLLRWRGVWEESLLGSRICGDKCEMYPLFAILCGSSVIVNYMDYLNSHVKELMRIILQSNNEYQYPKTIEILSEILKSEDIAVKQFILLCGIFMEVEFLDMTLQSKEGHRRFNYFQSVVLKTHINDLQRGLICGVREFIELVRGRYFSIVY